MYDESSLKVFVVGEVKVFNRSLAVNLVANMIPKILHIQCYVSKMLRIHKSH